jgi:hypothetical protein
LSGLGNVYEYVVVSDLPARLATYSNGLGWRIRSSCGEQTDVGAALAAVDVKSLDNTLTIVTGAGGRKTSLSCALQTTTATTQTSVDGTGTTTPTTTTTTDVAISPSSTTLSTTNVEPSPTTTTQIIDHSAATSLALGGGLLATFILPGRQAALSIVAVMLYMLMSSNAQTYTEQPCNGRLSSIASV